MNPATKSMLARTLACFTKTLGSKRLGWDRFLEAIASDHQFSLVQGMDDPFSWVKAKPELREAFAETYRPELLHQDLFDYLGELYFEEVFTGTVAERAKRLPSPAQLETIVAGLQNLHKEKTLTVLDAQAGTGRVLLAIYDADPTIIPFGVESDLDLYRIALTNFAIHRIPGFVLHADPHYHEIDIALPAGRSNWGYANRWTSKIADLAPTRFIAATDGYARKNRNGGFPP